MKDLERIKSEDLGCQVQDANPGNFAIEQEVAQLVGATVPAPTEPSADDARELGAQLLVFLRRALLPIRSALRTAVAAIYAHLDSRCTDYTPAAYDPFRLPAGPYDPMRPFVPRTLPNLMQALTAFSARKISNGSAPSDGIPDGTSLAHLLCSTDAANAVTEIVDDNYGWTMTRQFPWSTFPNTKSLSLNCIKSIVSIAPNIANLESLELKGTKEIVAGSNRRLIILSGNNKIEELTIPDVEVIDTDTSYSGSPTDAPINNNSALRVLRTPSLIKMGGYTSTSGWTQFVLLHNNPNLEEWYAENFESSNSSGLVNNCPKLWKIVFGKLTFGFVSAYGSYAENFFGCVNLIHFEIGADTAVSLHLDWWSPTNALDASRSDLIEQGSEAENNLQQFLQNFKDHIALRLTANGSGKTLTLSQAVRNAIHAAESTYGIENIIVTQKGWTISPAPN